jgi:putative sterol carrier protein
MGTMDNVECRSDSEYAERPLAITWNGDHYEIAEIVARWRGPSEKGFRVKTANGQAFDLTYREIPDEWIVQPI